MDSDTTTRCDACDAASPLGGELDGQICCNCAHVFKCVTTCFRAGCFHMVCHTCANRDGRGFYCGCDSCGMGGGGDAGVEDFDWLMEADAVRVSASDASMGDGSEEGDAGNSYMFQLE